MLFPARRFKKESLGRDCFFVKIVEMLGCFGDFEVQQECRGGSRPDRRKALCRRLQDEWQEGGEDWLELFCEGRGEQPGMEDCILRQNCILWQDKLKMQKISVIVLYIS